MRITKYFNKARWRLFIILLSVKWVFRVNLSDLVWYKNEKYTVISGVTCGMWDISKPGELGRLLAPRGECRKVISFSNLIGSFRSGYSFYRTNWLDIWERAGIADWMRKCKIW